MFRRIAGEKNYLVGYICRSCHFGGQFHPEDVEFVRGLSGVISSHASGKLISGVFGFGDVNGEVWHREMYTFYHFDNMLDTKNGTNVLPGNLWFFEDAIGYIQNKLFTKGYGQEMKTG